MKNILNLFILSLKIKKTAIGIAVMEKSIMLRTFCTLLIGLFMTFGANLKADQGKTQDKPLVIVFLGAPGSGKGTQAVELSKALGIPHISTGDLFRENIKNQTDLGQQAKSFLDKGQLVPDSLVFDILFDRISKPDCAKGYILDGTPRTNAQAHELEDSLRDKARIVVFNFKISDAEVIKRLAGRMVCRVCGRVIIKIPIPQKHLVCATLMVESSISAQMTKKML